MLSRVGRVDEIFRTNMREDQVKTDRMFFYLLLAQWVIAIAVALIFSPDAWAGKVKTIHVHVPMAVFLGLVINALPIALILLRPGEAITRHVVAAAQMLWSALLVHLSGGRIETHFHIFGSLAFLAYYRDWRILVTATLFVAGDHLARGLMWPESIYGVPNPEWWRFLEHAWWVAFEDVVLAYGCIRGARETHEIAAREASLEGVNLTIEQEVLAKTAALETSLQRYKKLVESTNAVPWEINAGATTFSYISPQATRLFGYEVERVVNEMTVHDLLHPDDQARISARFAAAAESTIADDIDFDIDYRAVCADGRVLDVRSAVSVHRDNAGQVAFRGITFDVTRQKKLERELNQAQKLESVGRLAAGVAHEINTPIQFVSDSVHFVRDAMQDLSGLIGQYRGLDAATMAEAEAAADLDYVLENVPKALDRSLDGLNRVATIVRSMKEFAHPDQKEMSLVDVNEAIQSTLIIAGNECKYVADVETDLGDLPLIRCYRGGVNQAILNIVVNAAHAIGDVVRGTEARGRIGIRTSREGDQIVVAISDTGGGIPERARERIFDPFFTTKDVGQGTGQGLAIARTVIVDTHGGELTFDTELGRGTTFFLRLPIAGSGVEGAAA